MINLPFEFELDHIGIAVKSLQEGAKPYVAMGMQASEIEEVASEKVRVQMFELKNSSRIELLEPTNADGPVAKFLLKRGPGIHHICLRVESIRQVLRLLKESQIRTIDETPKKGAHNCEVAFIHPTAMGGVLVELSEKMK